MSIYMTIYASQEAFLAHSEKIYEKRLFPSRRAKSSKGMIVKNSSGMPRLGGHRVS